MFEQYITNDYIRSVAIFLSLFVILRTLFYLGKKVIGSVSKSTRTDLDDIILEKMNKPFNFLILIISFALSVNELENALGQVFVSVSNKFFFSAGIIVVAMFIYSIFDIALLRIWSGVSKKAHLKLDDSLTPILHTIMKVVLVVLAVIYILETWGIEIGPLLAGLGVAGLAVALALQPTLANVFSGISIILDKSVKVGDLVYLDPQTKGTVKRIGIRSTAIVTFDNEYVIIPNTKLADSTIQNVALPEKKSRAVVPFGVAYGSDIGKVKKIILSEIKKIPHVLKDPEPSVRFIEMANSSLNFKAYYYVDSYENRFGSIDEANTRIYNALKKAKIEIPFPQMDVHLKKS